MNYKNTSGGKTPKHRPVALYAVTICKMWDRMLSGPHVRRCFSTDHVLKLLLVDLQSMNMSFTAADTATEYLKLKDFGQHRSENKREGGGR